MTEASAEAPGGANDTREAATGARAWEDVKLDANAGEKTHACIGGTERRENMNKIADIVLIERRDSSE